MYNYTGTKQAIGSASTLIKAANLNRHVLILQNDSDEAIYIKLGAAAVMSEGILLTPKSATDSGASRITLVGELNFTGAIYGICTSGSKNLTIAEGL